MSKIKLVGRHSNFKGKTLFEIAANLREVEGRVVVRKEFERYPEKSYYVLTKVTPDLSENVRKGEAWGYKVFRGKKFEGVKKIDAGGKSDWVLVPKEDVDEYCKIDAVYTPNKDHVPTHTYAPPLLQMLLNKEMEMLGMTVEDKLCFKLRRKINEWSNLPPVIKDSKKMVQDI